MLDRLKAIPKRLLEIWNNWTKKQKTLIVSAVAVLVVAVIILAAVLTRPDYETLTTCQDYNEMSQVTTLLSGSSYDYKVADNTLTVQVRKQDLTAAKMLIASSDIQPDGYSFEDAMASDFTTTDSDRNKKYQHYLEYKFKSDLEAMDGVKNASVTVSVPDDSNSFYQTTEESSVSVVLNITKSVSDETAESMANLLATAMGNKTTNNITIVSTDGTTLFNGASAASNSTGISYGNQQKYKAQIEATNKAGMKQAILATGLYDDAYFNMNLVLNWDAVNTIATEYSAQNGNDQALFSHSYEEISKGSDGASGTPGTSSNNTDGTTYTVSDGTSSTSEYSVKEYDYQPNELVTTTTTTPGSVVYDSSSCTVTLIKNVVYNEEECERLGYLDNMTWDEFKAQNTESTVLEVDNTWAQAFSTGTGIPVANITIMAYQKPAFYDAESTNIFSTVTFWLQIVLAAAILGLLVFVVIRSAKPLTVEEKEPELSVEEMLATTKENQPSVDEIDIHEKSETRKAIERFVDENPEAVALLLRNWLNDGWN
ncbi:MAG: flagellar M-ring protein FliF [Lachnospira sp.]|nr:flagellar M-ring protein FliF [Lachnospira sp.]